MGDPTRGLFAKFDVRRTDGSAGVAIAVRAGDQWTMRGVLTREAAQGRITGGVAVELTW